MSKKKTEEIKNKINKNDIKLIFMTTNEKLYSSFELLTIYFTSTICSNIKNNNTTHIEYDRKLKSNHIHIHIISIDLNDECNNKTYFIQSILSADNIIVLVDQENIESYAIFKSILNFISNVANVSYKILKVIGICSKIENILDNVNKESLMEISDSYGLKSEYKQFEKEKESDLVDILDEATLEGLENHHKALESNDEDIRSNAITNPCDYYSERPDLDQEDNSMSKCIIF